MANYVYDDLLLQKMGKANGRDETKGANKEIHLDCPVCGEEKAVVGYRSPYNGHFHGVCEKCGARLIE